MTLRVKMISLAAGPDGVFVDGKEYDLPDKLARAFVEAGAASPIDWPPPPEVVKAAKLEPETKEVVIPAPAAPIDPAPAGPPSPPTPPEQSSLEKAVTVAAKPLPKVTAPAGKPKSGAKGKGAKRGGR